MSKDDLKAVLVGGKDIAADKQRRIESTADVCELFSVAFAFPTERLAEALCLGEFQADLMACANELDVELEPMTTGTAQNPAQAPADLYSDMRKEYSRLYLSPGRLAVIYPYEGAFLHVTKGLEGLPTLFVNRIALDVEQYMKRAAVLSKSVRSEPADSIFVELDFLRLLYTASLANSRLGSEQNNELAGQWLGLADEFRDKHITNWLSAFMQKTIEQSRIVVYRELAAAAKAIFAVLNR